MRLIGKLPIRIPNALYRATGILALAFGAALSTSAQDQTVWVDAHNPIGLPDITQHSVNPDSRTGWCAAAAAANIMWNWSEYAPYNTAPRLVDHPDSTQPPQQNWPASWGNWFADSIRLRSALTKLIYGIPVGEAYGDADGMTHYLKQRGRLYHRTNNPEGLSVREYTKGEATYDGAMAWIEARAEVFTTWFWHQPDGSWVPDSTNRKSRHALVIAGRDPQNHYVYMTNGWALPEAPNGWGGDHHTDADPVDTFYYDRYNDIVTDGDGRGRFRIPAGGGVYNGLRGNNYLVRNRIAVADYVEMDSFIVVKRGGSPEVATTVQPEGPNNCFNRFAYEVFNPEPEAMYHFYLEVGGEAEVSQILGSVQPPSGWTYEFWVPNGPIANPGGEPDDGAELFGHESLGGPDGEPDVIWNPRWRGIHWYCINPDTAIRTNQSLQFSFAASAEQAYSLEPVRTTVVGEWGNEVLYHSMAGGLTRPCIGMGDSNCDGAVDNMDIDAFVSAIIQGQSAWEAAHPCDFFCANDINGDGVVSNFDIDPFVACIISGGCP